jgi:dipeptidyl aminopeptidase/acylaminoacyl peptidase
LQQGYAVFQPDYRESGSFGYDTVLQEYARGDVMSEDAQDILAGVDAVVKSHAVDPSRLYLLGHSYGSTLTDWIVSHDRRFRAAVSYEGFDFFYDWSRYSPYGTGAGIGVQHTVADTTPLTAPKLWAQNSAVLNAARVTTPTLFVVTENGMDCPSQAWLYGALRSNGVDSQFLLYHGEPHVIQKPANQVDLVNRVLAWFKTH